MALLLTIMKQQWHTDKFATPFLFKYTQKSKHYIYFTRNIQIRILRLKVQHRLKLNK